MRCAHFSPLSNHQESPKILFSAVGPITPIKPRMATNTKTMPPIVRNDFGFTLRLTSPLGTANESIYQLKYMHVGKRTARENEYFSVDEYGIYQSKLPFGRYSVRK